jgi:hypothetical protein
MKDCIASPEEVRLTVHELKPGKNDGCIGSSSDYFIQACSFTLLCCFLHSLFMVLHLVIYLEHQYPNMCIAANYRGITLSSVFS